MVINQRFSLLHGKFDHFCLNMSKRQKNKILAISSFTYVANLLLRTALDINEGDFYCKRRIQAG